MKKHLNTTKEFLKKNKTKILVTTNVVTAAALVVHRVAFNDIQKFVVDEGLYEKYLGEED